MPDSSSAAGAVKADSIGIKDLATAVDKAVKAVGEKHKVTFQPGFTINPTIINGRILREAITDLGQAQKIANEITQQVAAGAGGVGAVGIPKTLTPTVVWWNKHIICGFVERPPAIFTLE
jgi:hypothetical protein